MRKLGQGIQQMSIDELIEKISVVYYEQERNSRGDEVKVTEIVRCKVWAKVLPLNGKINDVTPERINKVTYRMTIRYRTDIKPDDEILWRGRRMKMTSLPIDIENYHKWTQFECEEVVADGAA